MTPEEWRAHLSGLEERLAKVWTEDAEDYRSALVMLHRAACYAEPPILNQYAKWKEQTLRDEAEAIRCQLDTAGFGYKYAPHEDHVACLKQLVVFIRALELVVSIDWPGEYPQPQPGLAGRSRQRREFFSRSPTPTQLEGASRTKGRRARISKTSAFPSQNHFNRY